jgi:hypothetical protein
MRQQKCDQHQHNSHTVDKSTPHHEGFVIEVAALSFLPQESFQAAPFKVADAAALLTLPSTFSVTSAIRERRMFGECIRVLIIVNLDSSAMGACQQGKLFLTQLLPTYRLLLSHSFS